jgi:hypothetical protein
MVIPRTPQLEFRTLVKTSKESFVAVEGLFILHSFILEVLINKYFTSMNLLLSTMLALPAGYCGGYQRNRERSGNI